MHLIFVHILLLERDEIKYIDVKANEFKHMKNNQVFTF